MSEQKGAAPGEGRGQHGLGQHGRVWRLAGPIILSNLSVPLLGAVDTAVVGHLPDAYYLGAVAVGALIFNFLYWGFGFLRMGTTGFAAQAYGADDAIETRAVLGRALILALGLGLVLILLQWPLLAVSMHLLEASPQVETLARDYFHYRIWSAPAALANYCFLGWFIGRHNMRAALGLQVWMNGVNIALDLLFVLGLGYGVGGVALATAVAEYSAVLVGLMIARRELARLGGAWVGAKILDRSKMRRMLAVNRDIFIRTLCLIFAFAFFTAEGAKLGDATLAANAVLMNFQHFLSYGLDGFAHAAEALVGGALGARKLHDLRGAVRTSGLWALIVAGLYTLAYWGLGGAIVDLLTGVGEVRILAREYLPWQILMPLVSIWAFQLDGIFIGATHTPEMRNGMLISLGFYLAGVWAFQPLWGNHGLWLALTLFMLARGVTLAVMYPRIERAAMS